MREKDIHAEAITKREEERMDLPTSASILSELISDLYSNKERLKNEVLSFCRSFREIDKEINEENISNAIVDNFCIRKNLINLDLVNNNEGGDVLKEYRNEKEQLKFEVSQFLKCKKPEKKCDTGKNNNRSGKKSNNIGTFISHVHDALEENENNL